MNSQLIYGVYDEEIVVNMMLFYFSISCNLLFTALQDFIYPSRSKTCTMQSIIALAALAAAADDQNGPDCPNPNKAIMALTTLIHIMRTFENYSKTSNLNH